MSSTFRQIDFDIIRRQLNGTKDWLNSIGIKTDESRFSNILKHVNSICYYKDKNKMQDLVDNFDNEILCSALLESCAFLDIHQAFRGLKNHQIPRAKLTAILNGPFLSKDEDPKAQNIHSRNTLFELQMAAKINNAGIEVVGFDDVDFILDGQQFNVQCKRIHSLKRIEKNVQKAYEQIQSRLKNNENQKGIICISIDKLAQKDGKILRVKKAKDIVPEMVKITNDFIETYKKYWQNFIDIRLIAILVYFQAAAIVEDLNLLTYCRQIEIYPIAIPNNLQPKKFALILSMVKKLQNTVDEIII